MLYITITNKTRKILWGKSGNRCCICKHELIIDATKLDDSSVIGEECHIMSGQINGPRYDHSYSTEKIDYYDNLILLCRIHHKMIDDQEDTYTIVILQQMKINHENWVTQKLSQDDQKEKPIRIRRVKDNIPPFLSIITSGKQIINIVDGAMGFEFDQDEINSENDVVLISGFFQTIQDFGDLLDDLGSGDRVKYEYEITQMINELLVNNLLVFGSKEIRIIEGGINLPSNFPITIIYIRHKDNKNIRKINEE